MIGGGKREDGGMDGFRYVMAVLMVAGAPPALAYWFIVHPFVSFWRRRGPRVTFGFLAVVYAAMTTGLVLARDELVVGDYGTRWVLVAAAVPLLVVAGWVQYHRKKHLKFKTLAGLPEIDPRGHGGELLTEGIYAKIRHPRYLEFMLGLSGWALVINYLSVYVTTAATFLLLGVIVILEERELAERFGEAYAGYRARVPRFIPRAGSHPKR
jgi:protein-S-isoprenylcysteine O-methyltransferase Ste14